jgi:hypothetical protein
MSTMVERVAQALRQEMETVAFNESVASFALARAAIAAMREPTEEMLDAWIRAPGAIKGEAGKSRSTPPENEQPPLEART